MTLGQKLYKARLENDMSAKDLAKKIGVSDTSIFTWEKDQAEPLFFNVILLSQVLGLSLNYLAGLEE